VLKPRLIMIGADTAGAVERNAAHERLELWLAQTVAADLRPLVALETAWREGRLPANARGLAFRLIENAGALDRVSDDTEIDAEAETVLKRYGVCAGRHSVFMPQLVRPRAAATLAVLWHFAHPGKTQSVFLARPGALSVPLELPRAWGECAAAGFRACGRIAVRLDLVERLAETIEQQPDQPDAALARIIGRPVRELGGVLMALGYQKTPPVEGAPAQWRHSARRRKRTPQPAQRDNAFAELANLLPPSEAPPRRRRSKSA
jgi:ATP-dependent RNA helicase SUPV3L1/SUV3